MLIFVYILSCYFTVEMKPVSLCLTLLSYYQDLECICMFADFLLFPGGGIGQLVVCRRGNFAALRQHVGTCVNLQRQPHFSVKQLHLLLIDKSDSWVLL